MADNVQANANTTSGATLATDDIGGVHFPRTKLIHGADGVNAGDVSDANPLPVDDAGGSLTVDNAALSVTGGGVEASALRVTLASDSTGVLSVDDNGGSLTVDNAALSVTGGGVEASALRVTIANDSTGVLSVDDNGGSLTVDGTVAATQSGTWNVNNVSGTISLPTGAATLAEQQTQTASLSVIDDWDESDRAKVNLVVGQAGITAGAGAVAASTPRVTLASDDPAVTALQLIDNAISGSEMQVDIVAALPAGTNNIGDVDVLSVVPGTGATNLGKAIDSAAGGTDTGVAILAIRDDSLTTLTPVDGDYVPLRVNSTGALHVTGGGGGTQYNVDDVAGATDTGTLLLAIRDDSLTTLTPADGDYVGLRVSSTGALHVTGGGGGTEYTEDVATPNPIVGTATMMERDDALATLTPIEGDWAAMRCSSTGALWVAVDGTVAATQSGTWNVTNISGTVSLPTGAATAANQATIIGHVDGLEGLLTTIDADTGNIVASVQLIDDVIATLGTTTYTEASTKAAVIGAVRKDATGTLVNTDNEVAPLQVDASGHLKVRLMDGITEYSEDVATPATISGTAIMMERDDALSTLTPIEGDWASLRCDSTGALWVSVNNTVSVNTHAVTQSGTWNITNVSGTVSLPTGASTLAEQQTQTTALSAIQTATQLLDDAIVADDAAFTPATTKVMMAGFEFDDTTPDSVNEGDAGAARMSANRCQYVMIRDNAGNERGLNVDASGNISVATVTTVSAVTSITNAVTVVGNAAHDAAVSGNPVLNAAEARTSESAVSASGDVVRLMADLVGKLVTMPYAPTDLQWQGTGSKTDTTDLAIKAAAGAGVRNYITDLICANSSATNVTVIVKDGSTEIARLPVPANGGVVHRFSTPLKGTANTAINLASSASATTIYMTAAGFTGR